MTVHSSSRWLLAWGTVCGMALAPAATAQSLEANGPVAIAEWLESLVFDESIDIAAAVVAPTEEPDAASPADPPVQISEDESALPVPVAPAPETENKQLGLPRAARTGTDETPDSVTTVLQKFDPRSNEVTKVLGALAVVIGLLLLIRTVLRRAGGVMTSGGRPSGILEILARYPVGRGQQLILLKLARRIVLLHQSGTAMTPLSEMTDPDEVAAFLARMEAGANHREAGRFHKMFTEFMSEHEAGEAPRREVPRRSEPGVKGRPTGARTNLPPGDAEIIDLTRGRSLFSRLLSRGAK
jgi:flagellar biogenesis protein FliO